ncbi:MAG: hypothetical protein ACKPKO_65175, partial [Candidatus Fonsibacter sp.]
MLEKQIKGTQKSKLFKTYEKAKVRPDQARRHHRLHQARRGASGKPENPIDKGVADAVLRCTSTATPTGESLFILNLSAEASLTNGFRYIKELLMQHHNFYLDKCFELLTNREGSTCTQSRRTRSRSSRNWTTRKS